MKLFKILLLAIGIILIILGVMIYLRKPQKQIIYQLEPISRYEIVKFCQELSATANEDWGYKSCLEELEKAIKEDLMGEMKVI